MNKRKTSIALCVALLAAAIPLAVQAADVTETSDWYNTDKTVVITPGAR